MNKLLFSNLILVSALANAASDAHGGIPTGTIFWQVFNLIFVAIIIFFVARKSVPAIFKQRQSDFLSAAQKSQKAREQAEKQYLDVTRKLEKLQATYDETLARVSAEAVDMRKQLVKEAQEQAQRIRTEAEASVRIEFQKAQRELHEKFVSEAVQGARQVLSKDIGSSDHQKLQSEFARNIEAVTP